MNSCVLMAEIIKDPELRYTSENQSAIAEMLVQFPGLKAEDPPATLKVVGWGNLASEIHQNYHKGDRVVIQGRLTMNTIDRPEGFKEKRAELTASRIHPMANGAAQFTPATDRATTPNNVVSLGARRAATSASDTPHNEMSFEEETPDFSYESLPQVPLTSTNPNADKDLDDIPF